MDSSIFIQTHPSARRERDHTAPINGGRPIAEGGPAPLIACRHANRRILGILRLVIPLALMSVPGTSLATPRTQISSASPLCAANIASDQRWEAQRLSTYHKLTAIERRKIDKQVSQDDQRQVCGTRNFAQENRIYVTQNREWRRKLAKLYQRLLHRLQGPARRHLIRDEQRWDSYHSRENLNPANGINQYVARADRLRELARELSVGPYPFISDHVIIKDAYFNSGTAHSDVHYPQLDNGGIDAANTNEFFAHTAHSKVAKLNHLAAQVFAPPLPPNTPFPLAYSLDQWFTLHRPGPALVDIDLFTYHYTGGGREYGGVHNYLVDLRTDKRLSLRQIFRPGTHWRHHLTPIVNRDFKRQFGASGSKYISRADIAWALQHPSNYCFRYGSLEIELNYNFPHVHFAVEVPYDQIRSLLQSPGLIAIAPHVAHRDTYQ